MKTIIQSIWTILLYLTTLKIGKLIPVNITNNSIMTIMITMIIIRNLIKLKVNSKTINFNNKTIKINKTPTVQSLALVLISFLSFIMKIMTLSTI